MKNLSPVWFLKSPIDAEQKHYILLAFLQEVNKEIKTNNVYSPIKRIFSLIKELDYFVKSDSLDGFKKLPLTEGDKSIIDFYSKNPISKEDREELDSIAKSALKILYKYADMGINLWKDIESRIKMYSLEVQNPDKGHGITIFRNMSTDEVFPYWWTKTEMKLDSQAKKGIMLKKIYIPNSYFSMSYEFIMHETMVSIGLKNGGKIPCTIIEISEDFNQNSEIFKIAKEKFIQEIDQEG
jgi:hypothetical protein